MKPAPKSANTRHDQPGLDALFGRRFGEVEHHALNAIRPYANNPRKHPEAQIIKLMASIREFGFTLPVLITPSGQIIAGEARVEAARRLGMQLVPVLVAQDWSEAKCRAYRLADNRLAELSSWDPEALAIEFEAIIEFDGFALDVLGWETAEIDVILEGSPADQASDPADCLPELPTHAITRQGDIWQLGGHRLLCGSSLEAGNWSLLMGEQVAAMVFSDPPYNVKVDGHVCGLGKVKHREFAMASGEMSKADFTSFLTSAIGAMSTHLKDGAVLTLAIDWRHCGEMLAAITGNGLALLNLCVWNKTNGGMGSLYRSKHELFWIAKKGRCRHTNNVALGKHGRYRANVWTFAGVNTFGKSRMADLADHPTVKPVALVAEAIRDVTHPGEIVIDGFMGSGTTILAAERTKRRGYGIELAPEYVDVAVRRWEKLTGRRATLAATGESFAEVAARREQVDAAAAGEDGASAHEEGPG